jgi:hypothetical protein
MMMMLEIRAPQSSSSNRTTLLLSLHDPWAVPTVLVCSIQTASKNVQTEGHLYPLVYPTGIRIKLKHPLPPGTVLAKRSDKVRPLPLVQ